MQKIQSRAAVLACLASLLFAAPAFSFETVDTLPWPALGRFPAAYPPDLTRPTDVFAEVGVMHDDNIIRRQTNRQGDNVGRIGAGIRHVQRIVGRESLLLDARLAGYGYQNFDTLSHIAYSLAGTWLWEASNDLSGSVIAARDSRLVDIAERQSADREIVTVTRLAAPLVWRLGPSFRLTGGPDFGWATSDLRPDAKLRTSTYRVGAGYISPLLNTLGLEYRHSHGDAPVPEFVAPLGTFVGNTFNEKEVAAVGTYFAPELRLRVDARLGHTERQYNEIPNRDFKGTTYRTAGSWDIGPKFALDYFVYKEPRSVIDVGSSHLIAQGTQFGPRWAYSVKTVFSLRWVRERRTGQGNPAVINPDFPLRDELTNTLRFGIGWEPERHWQVGLGLDRGTRYSNVFGRAYHYTAAMANLGYHY